MFKISKEDLGCTGRRLLINNAGFECSSHFACEFMKDKERRESGII